MRIVLFFLVLFLSLSCNQKKKNNGVDPKNKTIEIYSFSELEPLINAEDDTTYIINFWATWCKPCVKELPYFDELHTSLKDKNVKVLLVSLDFPEKLESQLIPFVKKHNLSPQVILLDDPNENDWIPKVDESWSGALPATLIFNKYNRAFYEKSFTRESLFSTVDKFINSKTQSK